MNRPRGLGACLWTTGTSPRLSGLIEKHEAGLLTAWVRNQLEAGSLRSGQIKEDELQDQSRRFLRDFTVALESGEVDDITGPVWTKIRDFLGSISRSRALQGFTPSETATFIFSMKEPLFAFLRTGQVVSRRTAAKPA